MKQRAIELFEKGVELEDAGDKNAAIEAYEEALIADPLLAAAHINLGTIYFHMRHYASAEGEYRRATEIDGEYALAFSISETFSTKWAAGTKRYRTTRERF